MDDEAAQPLDSSSEPDGGSAAAGWTRGADGTWSPPGWDADQAPAPAEPAVSTTPEPGPPPGAPGAWVAAPTLPVTHRRRRLLVGAAAVVLVAAGVSGGLAATTGGGNDASAAVIAAVNSTMADRTAQLSLTGTTTVNGTTVKETGSGPIDLTQNAGQLTVTVAVAGQDRTEQTRFLGGIEYMELPGLAQEFPGKSWMSMNLTGLEDSVDNGAAEGGPMGDPSAIFHLLGQNGNTVTALGPSTVDGLAVQGYLVTASPAAIKAEMNKADLPSWLKTALNRVTIGGVTSKVYVDSSGLVRAVDMNMTESVDPTGTMTVRETMTLSGYGTTTVNVVAPPATQVVTIQTVLATSTSGSSTATAT